MGMNATLHIKDTAVLNTNGDPTWQPVKGISGALGTTLNSLLAGENQSLDRQFGGGLASYSSVTADKAVKTGAGVLYGVHCLTNGTMAAIYDNTSAAGQALMIPGAMTAGQTVSFSGLGVAFTTGCYADWTSGTFLVLYL